MAIPLEHLGRALRLCGLTPSEKLIQTIEERLEKQQAVITPPPSDDEEEELEPDGVLFTEEELEIQAALAKGLTAGELVDRRREERKQRRKSMKSRKNESDEEREERERREEEERKAKEEEEERLEEERLEETRRATQWEALKALEQEEGKRKKKRELTWPVYKKKEDLKKLAKMKNRYKRFVTWDEFVTVIWAYYLQTQYTGQDILWAFRTWDPKLDYELEPERFIEKETKRFIKLADFKKENFFDFKEFIEDYNKEANYDMGVAEKKKKLKLKET